MKNMTKTERRWRDGSDETRFMADGMTVRCQAVSKTKLNRIREERNDQALTPDDVWPEAQCARKAVPGKLVCGGKAGHGGNSHHVPYRNVLSMMPVDLREKMEILSQNPQLIDRSLELSQLSARNLQLFEEMSLANVTGSEADGKISEGLACIQRGEVQKGAALIQEAMEGRVGSQKRWREIRENMALLKDLTKTQRDSIVALRQMITSEQFMAVLAGIADSVKAAVEEYIDDPTIQAKFINRVGETIQRLINAGSGSVHPALVGERGREGLDPV